MKKREQYTSESPYSSSYTISKSDSGSVSKGCKSKYKLVVVDFDWSMINCHSHNEAARARQLPITLEENRGLVLDDEVYGETELYSEYDEAALEKWATSFFEETDRFNFGVGQVAFFRELLEDGVQIVIASHTRYPKIIDVALVKMGFTSKEIEKIHVICGVPLDALNGKNEHIDLAMELAGVKLYEEVLLIDDSDGNLLAARKKNIDVVKVSPWCSYVFDAKVACGYVEENDESTNYGSDKDLLFLLGEDGVRSQDLEHCDYGLSGSSDESVVEVGCCF